MQNKIGNKYMNYTKGAAKNRQPLLFLHILLSQLTGNIMQQYFYLGIG